MTAAAEFYEFAEKQGNRADDRWKTNGTTILWPNDAQITLSMLIRIHHKANDEIN